MPELPSATPAPRPATTRWASASPPPPRISWATNTPSSTVPARSNSPTTCAPQSRRSMPPSWSARPMNASCRSFRSSCASLRISASRAFLFLNKIDRANKRIRETLATLQPASRIPLVLRQIPIWNGDLIAGFVDLALERAFVYREHKASEVVALEGGDLDREKEARFSMLEKLADHDDALMEQLLDDIPPPRDAIFDDLARELREGLICPVLLGSALRENGVLRLMKALRHESPGIAETAKRLGASSPKDALAYVFKTVHLQHGGKLSLTRMLAGHLDDGVTLLSSSGEIGRVSGILAVSGGHDTKRAAAGPGDTVALGKLDAVKTGDTVSGGKTAPAALVRLEPLPPVLAMALSATDRKDDVKLGQALLRLNEEDPSLTMIHNAANPRHRAVGTRRNASAGRAGAAARPFRRQRQVAAPGDRISGDHSQVDHPARPAQEAVRRSWPVRRCGAGDQADAARQRLRVSRKGGWRRGAAKLHRRRRRGRGRWIAARAARLSRHRRPCDADRWLLSQRRFLRSCLPYRGADRGQRSAAAMPAGVAGADPSGRRSSARPTPPPGSTPSCRAGAARFSASTPARAGRGGTVSAP